MKTVHRESWQESQPVLSRNNRRKQEEIKEKSGGENMEAKAHLKYLRISPRKVSILCDIIRGKDAKTACVYLMQTPKAASEPMLKLLKSNILPP